MNTETVSAPSINNIPFKGTVEKYVDVIEYYYHRIFFNW